MTLEELRLQIDEVDSKLIELYERRLDIAENIAKAKMEINKPVFDEAREKDKIAAVRNKTVKEENKDGVEELFVFLMNKSKERQRIVANGEID